MKNIKLGQGPLTQDEIDDIYRRVTGLVLENLEDTQIRRRTRQPANKRNGKQNIMSTHAPNNYKSSPWHTSAVYQGWYTLVNGRRVG
jgi:hypothetical protein